MGAAKRFLPKAIAIRQCDATGDERDIPRAGPEKLTAKICPVTL